MGTDGTPGSGRVVLFLALLLLGAGCSSKDQSGGASSVPGSPTTTTTATPTATATVSPGPSPAPTVTRSATPKATSTVSPSPRVTPTVQVSQPSGSTTNLKSGQVISLKLQEHADGGYGWQFSKQPSAAVLSVVTDQSLPASSPSSTVGTPTPGATAFHRWTFRAVGPGTTSFTVVERRPNDANPLHDYTLTVVVSP